jgi:Tol biopolymer transport system component
VIRRAFVVVAVLLGLAVPSSGRASFPGVNGRIIFTSSRDSSALGELYSVAEDGSGLVRLTTSAMGTFNQDAAWSPDGRRIAFTRLADHTRRHLAVMNADGSGVAFPVPDPYESWDDAAPSWSPRGDEIVFASTRPFNDAWRLWVVRPDGSGLRQLTSGWGTDPSWSPDGTRIAYIGPGSAVFVMNADGSDPHPLTQASSAQPESQPSWSPDGSHVLFGRYAADWQTSNAHPLFVINSDGSGERQLTSGGFYDARGVWAPDGSKILFARVFSAFSSQLFLINADGSGLQQLTSSAGSNYSPDWARVPTDLTAPTITIAAPAQGATYPLGQLLRAAYSCADEAGGSGLASCDGDLPVGAAIDTASLGTKAFTVNAGDLAGNSASLTSTYTVVDETPPAITISTPADGAVYALGANVQPVFSCADQAGGSGVQSCSDGLADRPLDTSSVGVHTFTVTARDGAGNSQTASRSYTVIWPFSGFFSPVANPPTLNTINPGDSVPLRFSLGGDRSIDALAAGSPTVQQVDCASVLPLGPASTAGGALSYNANQDRYTFQWKSDKSWAGTCRQLTLTLRDGTLHQATFKLVK